MNKSKLKAIVVMTVLGCALAVHAQLITTTPVQDSTTNNEWQTFQDNRYTFQFEYPAKWSSIGNRQGAGGPLILKNEQKSEIITISGINLAVIGISYCGAYPQDSRCEVFKTESGDVWIDWNVDGEAYAMFSSQNSTYGVGFTLHNVNPETKTIFRKILSTFKFLNKPASTTQSPQTLSAGEKTEGQNCLLDTECISGVCNFIKQNWGQCASANCVPGSQVQGISDISFFCNQNNKWQKIKNLGEKCNYDYECFKRTCKDSPGCHLEDYKYSCKNNVCIEEKQQNACEKQGLKRITSKSDADSNRDGSCFPSMAQREKITVCAPCGNGVCDTELESKCNCPEDCK